MGGGGRVVGGREGAFWGSCFVEVSKEFVEFLSVD